jgi:dihydroorotase
MISRRALLSVAASAVASAQRPGRQYDLLIKNGEVKDPARGFSQRADVAVLDGKIAAIETQIEPDRARDVIDAKGLYVTPGLVDLHTHCYYGGAAIGVEPDKIGPRSGVTTWVDAGSFGYDTFHGFRRFIVEPSQARVFAFIYLYPNSRNPDVDPVKYVRGVMKQTGETAVNNRDAVIGIKLQVGSNMNGRYSLDFLKIARELCDAYKLPLMAHISFAPPETEQVMDLMRAGDIVTHAYNGHTLGILDAQGKIKPKVKEARERGVLFDVGHGLGSFNFPAAKKCLDAGFVVDTISTDIYTLNINGPVFDMPTTMTKMLHLGMSFDDVLLRSTANPAKIVNRVEGLGTLRPGAPADIALLAVEDADFRLIDSQKNAVTTKKRIVSRGAICKGRRYETRV